MSSTELQLNTEFELARKIIKEASNLLHISISFLRDRSLLDGRVSSDLMDEHQLVSFEIAQSAAEIAAAHHLLDYAKRVRENKRTSNEIIFEDKLALLFVAETFSNVAARIDRHPEEFGVSPEQADLFLQDGQTKEFVRRHWSADNLAVIANDIEQNQGQTGDYLLDEEHEMMRDTFRKFSESVVAPLAEEIHRKDLLIPPKILDSLIEMGGFGLSIPERFGGLQSDEHEDNMGMIVVTEELSRGSLGGAGSLITRPEIIARALLSGGTEEQKQKWLPLLASGERLGAVAVTEPDYGSDVASMKMPATKTEGGWYLDGTKTWCTFAGKANLMLVLARTNPENRGHKRLSLFLVEKPSFDGHEFEYRQDSGGTVTGKAISTIGYRGMHSFEVSFDRFFIPDENLIGLEDGLGKGFYFMMAGFSGGRIQTAARAVGVMQAAFDKAYAYARERNVFGKAIGDYQLTKVKLAKMAMLLVASRQFTYAVGRLMDEGQGKMEASLVKFFTCRVAEWVAREALQIHGGMGYAEEYDVSRYFVDARVLSIFEGAEETLALKVIARSLVDNIN